jgi:hypothetical protein
VSGVFNLPVVVRIEPEPLPDNIAARDIVRAAYLGDERITNKQLRAALGALNYELPKRGTTGSVGINHGFAAGLERANKQRLEREANVNGSSIIDGTAQRIDADAND